MKIGKKLLEFDAFVERWIQQNRIKWVFLIIFIGISVSMFANILLGGDTRQGLMMAFMYTTILVIIEFIMHGD